jgi:hypothetical protein
MLSGAVAECDEGWGGPRSTGVSRPWVLFFPGDEHDMDGDHAEGVLREGARRHEEVGHRRTGALPLASWASPTKGYRLACRAPLGANERVAPISEVPAQDDPRRLGPPDSGARADRVWRYSRDSSEFGRVANLSDAVGARNAKRGGTRADRSGIAVGGRITPLTGSRNPIAVEQSNSR